MIHAEIFRKLLSVSKAPDLDFPGYTLEDWKKFVKDLGNNFPGLYDYYMRYEWNVPKGKDPSNAQHEAMAEHYRDQIKNALKDFDSTKSESLYNNLAWSGLQNTVAWEKLGADTTTVKQTVLNFISSNTSCK